VNEATKKVKVPIGGSSMEKGITVLILSRSEGRIDAEKSEES
jgi:hypothetical protein